jgi:hypothetical protein
MNEGKGGRIIFLGLGDIRLYVEVGIVSPRIHGKDKLPLKIFTYFL